jgi:hypothetical protein
MKNLITLLILIAALYGCQKSENEKLSINDVDVIFSKNGFPVLLNIKNRKDSLGSDNGYLKCGNIIYNLNDPELVKNNSNDLIFNYKIDSLNIDINILYSLTELEGAAVLKSSIKMKGIDKPTENITIHLPYSNLPDNENIWLPLREGKNGSMNKDEIAVFQFCGETPLKGKNIALPLLSYTNDNLNCRVTYITDPYFSTQFSDEGISYEYIKDIKLKENGESRTFNLVFDKNKTKEAMDWFYKLAIPEILPGNEWIHDIAMVDYDFMSDGGKGWYNDIDALSKSIALEDRKKVFLLLHGWYDHVGQYCFDINTKQFKDNWKIFTNYDKVKAPRDKYNLEGVKVSLDFDKCVPIDMTLKKIHQRINYAKEKGFMVGLYYADGTNSCDGLESFNKEKVLYQGGWVGPDTKGTVFCQNPINPDVYSFYYEYSKALLNEFGEKIDALVWDESFVVKIDDYGKPPYEGYAASEMMNLTRDVVLNVQEYNKKNNKQIAFLGSDIIGGFPHEKLWAPYSIMTHGTYQDAHCRPYTWAPAIFANYRNVVWSCLWWPVSRWDWVEIAVKDYQAPVSISNGWGDNKGFSEMDSDMQNKVIDLFNYRKKFKTKLKAL